MASSHWACSPTTNLFGLKPNYEPFWAEAQLRTFGLKPNYKPGAKSCESSLCA
ncbi:MAG: hypothetical protein MUC60_17505 [Oscillatoria sp. Prado101]|nr:hypothetical protein [Oscillatoria sp. Prado101]